MPFLPSDLTGLFTWHKADDLGLANGAALATWADSSGNSRNLTQVTAGNRPTYVTNSINGLGVVSFNGTSNLMKWPIGFNAGSNNTVFILCKPVATTPAGLLDSAYATANGYRNYTAGNWEWHNNSPSFSLGLPNTNAVVLAFTATLAPARRILYERNNVLISTNTNASTTAMVWSVGSDPSSIGAINYGAPYYSGTIGEYIIYNRALSGTERTQVADYLTAKWLTAPPTAPTSLAATAASSSAIDLTWTASTGTGITGYSVERCQGVGCSTFSVVGTPTGTAFGDTGLVPETSYSYRVRATSAYATSSYSSTVTAVTGPTPPTAPTSLVATAASSSAIDLTWTASTGTGITGYSVERCEGVGCSTFTEVGTPTGTSFSDTGLLPSTSCSYRVRAIGAGGPGSYSSTVTAVTEAGEALSGVLVRSVSSVVTFAGVALTDVISARGQVVADSGWPSCSVFVTAKPATGNEENALSVVAGAGNNVTRFVGRVRRFRPSAFPKGIEIVSTGTLAYAAEWAPSEDILFDETFPSGATDEDLVQWALDFVPGVSYVGANIEGTGITLGTEAPEAFDWKAGMSAWQYVQQLDQATLYRTYQQQDGTIRRVRMIGHPSGTTTNFTLGPEDILEGSTGDRNTEQTRNAAIVRGHDYGDTLGPVLGAAYGANDFQDDGSVAATRHPEQFSSDLIEDGNDEDGTPLGYGGLDAQDIADAILDDVCKEFVVATIRSWRDDAHGPGQTCLLDTLDRLAIGEPMWVQAYAWEVSDGWASTYTLSGGGLEGGYPDYLPPPV